MNLSDGLVVRCASSLGVAMQACNSSSTGEQRPGSARLTSSELKQLAEEWGGIHSILSWQVHGTSQGHMRTPHTWRIKTMTLAECNVYVVLGSIPSTEKTPKQRHVGIIAPKGNKLETLRVGHIPVSPAKAESGLQVQGQPGLHSKPLGVWITKNTQQWTLAIQEFCFCQLCHGSQILASCLCLPVVAWQVYAARHPNTTLCRGWNLEPSECNLPLSHIPSPFTFSSHFVILYYFWVVLGKSAASHTLSKATQLHPSALWSDCKCCLVAFCKGCLFSNYNTRISRCSPTFLWVFCFVFRGSVFL